MILKNKTSSPRELRINGKIVVVKPLEKIKGEKIVYDSRSFEKIENKNSSIGLPKKKTKDRRKNKWHSTHSEKEAPTLV